MPKMSFSAYARHRGISNAAVTQAVASGRVKVLLDNNGQRYLDSEDADRTWAASKTRGSPQEIKAEQELEGSKKKDDNGVPSITDSKAIKEAYLARLSKMDYDEKMGKLVDAEKVRAEAAKIGRVFRDQILLIPDRISPQLASLTDSFEVHQLLTQELMQVLEELSRGLSSR